LRQVPARDFGEYRLTLLTPVLAGGAGKLEGIIFTVASLQALAPAELGLPGTATLPLQLNDGAPYQIALPEAPGARPFWHLRTDQVQREVALGRQHFALTLSYPVTLAAGDLWPLLPVVIGTLLLCMATYWLLRLRLQ